MGAVTGFGTGVVTAGIKRFIYGDSYSFDDAVHDVGKSTFGGALTGAITGGYTKAVSKIANKGVSSIKYEVTWNKSINATQEMIEGTNIPKSFRMIKSWIIKLFEGLPSVLRV